MSELASESLAQRLAKRRPSAARECDEPAAARVGARIVAGELSPTEYVTEVLEGLAGTAATP